MATRQELAEQVFLDARATKPADRNRLLDKLCADDRELRRMVEEMLAEDEQLGSFLEHPPLDFPDAATVNSLSSTQDADLDDGHHSNPVAKGRLAPGLVLNKRFVIVRFVGKGGMGEVYEAEDTLLLGSHIALKTILPEIADDPGLQRRFEQEVLSAREVVHANLCPIYHFERCDEPPPGFLFLTMKLLPGETLAARLRRSGALPKEEGLAIARQMADGLTAIHAAGIVHRDIKPTNVMLDGVGSDVRLWITDFGLARALEVEPSFCEKPVIAGTPGYIAPELFRGQPPSKASDLFAFGVVLHKVFTGEKPAQKEDGASVTPSARLSAAGVPAVCADLIKGCLDDDPKRRCEAFEHALEPLGLKRHERRRWTRRQFVGMATAAACSVTAAGWFERDWLYNLTHPLPGKRFVALLNWPKTGDSQVAPMLTGALSAIKSELARLEAFDRNLFVISPDDVSQDLTGAAHLKDVCDPLGANLALAASGGSKAGLFGLDLRLLDPITGHPIREKRLTCAATEITSLPGKAAQAAASLLNLNHYLKRSERTEPGTQSTKAFTAFQAAETLMKRPNEAGLDAAIEKYKEAVDLDPHYAIAHAKLAMAYSRLYGVRLNPGFLDLARGNSARALALDPTLVEGHLALALILQQTGNEQGALDEAARALKYDPSNPQVSLRQAEIYKALERWSYAEQAYRRVLSERPNDWVTYNELGVLYHGQGRFQDAVRAFRDASSAAPASAMPLSNLGVEYLHTGDFAAATETLKKSLALAPDYDLTLTFLSLSLRCQGKYEEALTYAQRAVKVNPGDDTNWQELGDCYASLSSRQSDARSAYVQAAMEVERQLQVNKTSGPGWMLLALYHVKSGAPADALALVQKAESLGAGDMESQLSKVRILELMGKRDEALATVKPCFDKGANDIQIALFPDMQALRKDPRYRQIVESRSRRADADRKTSS